MSWESILGRGNTKCEDPILGTYLEHLNIIKEANMAEGERIKKTALIIIRRNHTYD